ncbi:hypothetical protein TNCT_292231 [Trichonephila clavata]|uniref:Uncharacterized protein n=1 Tax=Trichonephila clavata TaxID=2740835 RepID=A0A8X6J425_TRICU|nr:hypothetical protein TNCT_292231 [Trichonephila clavata]
MYISADAITDNGCCDAARRRRVAHGNNAGGAPAAASACFASVYRDSLYRAPCTTRMCTHDGALRGGVYGGSNAYARTAAVAYNALDHAMDCGGSARAYAVTVRCSAYGRMAACRDERRGAWHAGRGAPVA